MYSHLRELLDEDEEWECWGHRYITNFDINEIDIQVIGEYDDKGLYCIKTSKGNYLC